MKYSNKNILITGSSSGIGKALKEYFISQGNTIIGISIADDEYNCDVSDKNQLQTAFEDIKNKYGKIDMVINCAGFGLYGTVELTKTELVHKQYDVNVIGMVNIIQLAFPLLSDDARIINISSVSALFPLPFRAFYCSSKSAVSMLSDCLRIELSKTNIQVTAICPCDVRTNFSKNRAKNYDTNEKYGNAVKACVDKIEQTDHKRMPVEKAVKKLVKIIEKKKLKPQYIIGAKEKLLYHLQKFVPKSCILKIMERKFFKKK